jgi:hypothetical protein
VRGCAFTNFGDAVAINPDVAVRDDAIGQDECGVVDE